MSVEVPNFPKPLWIGVIFNNLFISVRSLGRMNQKSIHEVSITLPTILS